MTHVKIFTKPGCHLCEVADEIVETVLADYPEDAVTLEHVDILTDPVLFEEYGEKIPVVTIDDHVHAIWRVDAERFRSAIDVAEGGRRYFSR